ncbi:hypothetical protein GQ53DRAFT_752616 [Thozetella sp. PMI_491]|nr:hypothetical protein GQ53DRAFT_752616 [Thozetella sp. PMI_491]
MHIPTDTSRLPSGPRMQTRELGYEKEGSPSQHKANRNRVSSLPSDHCDSPAIANYTTCTRSVDLYSAHPGPHSSAQRGVFQPPDSRQAAGYTWMRSAPQLSSSPTELPRLPSSFSYHLVHRGDEPRQHLLLPPTTTYPTATAAATMHARDAAGRRVSLLNDDDAGSPGYYSQDAYLGAAQPPSYGSYARSASSSPNTPELLRSDSYDSQMSNDPMSPITPMYDYSRAYANVSDARSPYDEYAADSHAYLGAKQQAASAYGDRRSASYDASYDDEAATSPAPAASERPGKRYPCRYRDSHGCEKTFTTSGHASRHSKIHTAEKAVQCVFQGCPKKFTRADNMKQHLETHYKDKSRSSARPALSSSDRKSSSKSSSSSSRSSKHAAALPSPGGAWDMRGLNLPLLSRPSAARTPSSGLDALAMAVACQEGS